MGSLTADLLAAGRWWLVIMALGAVATPIARYLFHRLPDGGYAVAKPLGVLLVSYLFWLLGVLGFTTNATGAVTLALALTLAAAVWAERRLPLPTHRWLRQRSGTVATVELLFALLFAAWVGARLLNPTLAATEKPMEIAFLNAIGRADAMPPADPWLSGFSISYYYFGYVMTSVIGRLAAVPEMVGFNLALAWLVAATAAGAFGIVYNIVRLTGKPAARWALPAGVTAGVAVPLAGNLQILLEVAHANGFGPDAFWRWLNIQDIAGPATTGGFGAAGPRFWWWWRASRVIREQTLSGAEGLQPIHENPAFSFVLGDLHPHVLALPFALLALALALQWFMAGPAPGSDRRRSQLQLAFTALAIGGLSFLNTWDVLIYLFVVVGAVALAAWRRAGSWHAIAAADVWRFAGIVLAGGILLYLPFYAGFRSQTGFPFILPTLVRPTRLPHFLVIFGQPLLVCSVLLAALLAHHPARAWRTGLVTIVSLLSGLGLVLAAMVALVGLVEPMRIQSIAASVGIPAGGGALADVTTALRLLPELFWVRFQTPGVRLLLAALIGVCVMLLTARLSRPARGGGQPHAAPDHPSPDAGEDGAATPVVTIAAAAPDITAIARPTGSRTGTTDPLPFLLLLIITAALLTLGPEFLYLKDSFGQRMNTIFKFYYQAWLLFGVAAAAGVPLLWQLRPRLGAVTAVVYVVLLIGVLRFPVAGVIARGTEFTGPPSLNGMAHLAPDEQAAITWLRDAAAADAVVLEAVGGQYSAFARVAAHSGVPTLIGWAGHEYQWRGFTPEPDRRTTAVERIYNQPDWNGVDALLDQYGVDFIYVGALERSRYNPAGLGKFDTLPVAYANDTVTIYAWR